MVEPSRRAISQDDTLPPVEPPSAGFLVQLFLVPAIIVAIIVAVWIAFHWLAQLGNDPEGYLKALRRPTEGRWQAALNLANDLRGPGGKALKQDAALAGELAGILNAEAASGRPRASGYGGEQSRALCDYLCRALGEFAVPEAAPPLVARAADVAEPRIARSAVEALAVLAASLAATGRGFADPGAVTAAVIEASRSDDAGLRSAAAFALGVFGGDAAAERLGALAADGAEDVRFNAATGLARLGRPEAYATLAEMLAVPDVAVAAGDEAAQASRYRRALIVVNALKAVGLLVDAVRETPPESIRAAVANLADDSVADVRVAATALAGKFDRIAEPAASR